MAGSRTKWILLIVLALIWGSSFILIKRGLVGLSAYQLASMRIIWAALFLIAIGFRSLAKIPLGTWKYLALTAVFGTFIPAFLFSVAQTEISSSVSSVLNSLTPLNTLVIGILLFSLDYRRNQVIGVVLGLAGSAILILNGALSHPDQNYWYTILIIIASVCYALNVNLIKKYLSGLSPLSITTGNFVVLLVPALIILACTGIFDNWQDPEIQQAAIYVLILGVVGTGIANIIFFKLIQISTPVFATSVTYLIPVVAFFWGLLDGEMLTPIQFAGAFIVLVGVYMSSRK